MVVQSNFGNRDFVIDHKFSIYLRSGEFPGRSNTVNLSFLKIVFTFFDERHGTRSFGNIPPPSGSALLTSVMTRASFCCSKKVRKLLLFSTKVAFMCRKLHLCAHLTAKDLTQPIVLWADLAKSQDFPHFHL